MTYECLLCKKSVLTYPVLIDKEGKTYISGELAFHFWDTHGLPVEITEEWINKCIKMNSLKL